MKHILPNVLLVVFFTILASTQSRAQNIYQWIGGADTTWEKASNWSPTGIPELANDVAVFNNAGGVAIRRIPNLFIGGLRVLGNSRVRLSGDAFIEINDQTGVDVQVAATARLDLIGFLDQSLNHGELRFRLLTGATMEVAGIVMVRQADSLQNLGSSRLERFQGSIAFIGNGRYFHNRDGGAIPEATWGENTSCVIRGIRNNVLSPLANTTFGTLNWDCRGQAVSNFWTTANPITINIAKDLVVENTNGSDLIFQNGVHNLTLTIRGNFTVGDGVRTSRVVIKNNQTGVCLVNLGGNLRVNTNATLTSNNANVGVRLKMGIEGLSDSLTISGGGTLTGSALFLEVSKVPAKLKVIAQRAIDFRKGVFIDSSAELRLWGNSVVSAQLGDVNGRGLLNCGSGNLAHSVRYFGTENTLIADGGKLIEGLNTVHQYESSSGNVKVLPGSFFNLQLQATAGSVIRTVFPADSAVTVRGTLFLNGGLFDAGNRRLFLLPNSNINRSNGRLKADSGIGVIGTGTYTLRYQNFSGPEITTGDEWSNDSTLVGFVYLVIGRNKKLHLNHNKHVNNLMQFSSGRMYLGNYHLTLNSTASQWFPNDFSSYAVTLGTGEYRRKGTTAAQFRITYPIGSSGEMCLFIIQVLTKANVGEGIIGVRTVGMQHPSVKNTSKNLNRYWFVQSNNLGFTGFRGEFRAKTEEVEGGDLVVKRLPHGSNTWVNPPGGSFIYARNAAAVTVNNTIVDGIWTAGEEAVFTTLGTFQTAQNGDWSNPSTWIGGVVPVSGSDVEVSHIVKSDVNVTVGTINISPIGKLALSNRSFIVQTQFNNGGIIVDSVSGGLNFIEGNFLNIGSFRSNQPWQFQNKVINEGLQLISSGAWVFSGTENEIGGQEFFVLQSDLILWENTLLTFNTQDQFAGIEFRGKFFHLPTTNSGKVNIKPGAFLSLANANPNGFASPAYFDKTLYDFSALNSNVRYSRNGDQEVIMAPYFNLESATGGTKTLALNHDTLTIFNTISIIDSSTLSSQNLRKQLVILGSQTTQSNATIAINNGRLNLSNDSLSTLEIRSVGTISTVSGTFSQVKLGHVLVISTNHANTPVTPSGNWEILGNFRHISDNNFIRVASSVTLFNRAGLQTIDGPSSGETSFGILRLQTAGGILKLERPIYVRGSAQGTGNRGQDATLGVLGTARIIFGGHTIHCELPNNASISLGTGSSTLDMTQIGSKLRIAALGGNVRFTAHSIPVLGELEISQGTVTANGDFFFTGPILNNGTWFQNSGHVNFSYIIGLDEEETISGNGTFSFLNATLEPSASMRVRNNLIFRGSTFTLNSTGTVGSAFKQLSGSFTFNSLADQTIVAPVNTGPVYFNTLRTTGFNRKFLPVQRLYVRDSLEVGSNTSLGFSSAYSDSIIIGSPTTDSVGRIISTGGIFNVSAELLSPTVVIYGKQNTIINGGLASNLSFSKVVFASPCLATDTVSAMGNFEVRDEIVHGSNGLLHLKGRVVAAFNGGTASISGNTGAKSIIDFLTLGTGQASATFRLDKDLTLGRRVNFTSATLPDFGIRINGKTLELAGMIRSIGSNSLFTGDSLSANTVSSLVLSGDSALPAISIKNGFRNFRNLVIRRSGPSVSFANSLLVEKELDLQAGQVEGNNLNFAPLGSWVIMAGGNFSTFPTYVGTDRLNFRYLVPTTPGPEMPSNFSLLDSLDINPGAANRVFLNGSQRVMGDLLLNSGILEVGNHKLDLAGTLNKVDGNLNLGVNSRIRFSGNSNLTFPDDVLTDSVLEIDSVLVANKNATASLGNQSLRVRSAIVFEDSAGIFSTGNNIDTKIDLGQTGDLLNERPNSYLKGRVLMERVANNGPFKMGNIGVRFDSLTPVVAAELNALGGSFRVERVAGITAAISNGNVAEGYGLNQSIARKWIFSPIGVLSEPTGMRLSWLADDDNACPTCSPERVAPFRREDSSSPWIFSGIPGAAVYYTNSDLGNGRREVFAMATTFTEYTVGYQEEPLPVVWGSLAAKRFQNYTSVYWSTLSEKDNSHFVIERSLTGRENDFIGVGKVSAVGNSSSVNSYRFDDHNSVPENGKLIYYRVTQVDFDGATTTSPKVAVRTGNQKKFGVEVYPNPFIEQVSIALLGEYENEGVSFTLSNSIGKVLFKGDVSTLSTMTQLLTQTLPQGAYYLTFVNSNGEREIKKIVKQ